MKTKLFLVLVVIVSSANNVGKGEIEKVSWLIGTWENRTSRGSIYETWTKTNDATLSGKSYMLKENDTIVFETIRLTEEHGTLFYTPTVRDQNDGLPVRFSAKAVSSTMMVFENPQHDFPQTISYTKINADSLIAEISGVKNGQERKQFFPMRRVK